MNGITGRIDKTGRYEDQKVKLRSLRDLGLEQATDHRQVTKKWDLVIDFAQLLGNQSAWRAGLPIVNDHAGREVFAGEQRLLDVVKRGDHVVARRQSDGAAIVDKA